MYKVKASNPISTKTISKPACLLTFFLSYCARSSGLFVLNPETNMLPLPVNRIIVAIGKSKTATRRRILRRILSSVFWTQHRRIPILNVRRRFSIPLPIICAETGPKRRARFLWILWKAESYTRQMILRRNQFKGFTCPAQSQLFPGAKRKSCSCDTDKT